MSDIDIQRVGGDRNGGIVSGNSIRGRLLASDGRDLGDVMDECRKAGWPIHLASRTLNDLVSEGLLRLDEEQVIQIIPEARAERGVSVHDCPTCHCGEEHLVSCNASAAQCLCGWYLIDFHDEKAVRQAAGEHVRATYGRQAT